ncbi:MAG: cytochrome-c oxidase, cbb3-type subunit I [Halobacteriovoraceae bacterium]|nr:cytochrome-c oxidase, cbb3-type subunit I [Halobacteriovoraceae bacterium]
MSTVTENQEGQKLETFSYDDKLTKLFVYATLVWGVIALFLGVWIAFELASYKFNLNIEYFTFGRLRPLHTNAAIFAFVGNAIFAGVYYSTQRLLKTRMASDLMGRVHFWGWQLIIVAAAITLPLGMSSAKEYAELEWPLDIAVAAIWVTFGVNFFLTLKQRRERHIYVALWFYIATIITVAVLYVVNNLALPVDFMKSYSVFAGVQDALVQWWYGHNAVAFFLTTPFLGLMYYFIPKAINRPVYSYRLSIIHFWSLIFVYIWAGPHHLLYSTLPEWVQTVGVGFSVALWAPSWGGMINGLLTLRGAWDRVRKEPILKFLATAVTFYGMSTFEGPLLSIKSVNSLAHFTDWIVGHVHSGTIGWNYMLTSGMLYFMVPKLWNTKLYSDRLANIQFWSATVGLLLYIMSMWTAGITQGLMWRAIDETGKLVYPNFVETVVKILPMYWVRAFGGTLVLFGFVVLVYNVYKTIKGAPAEQEEEVYKALPLSANPLEVNHGKHRKLEGLPFLFSVLSFVAIIIGSVIELVPSLVSNQFIVKDARVKPYSALEVAGRDVYVREGCYTCHSQLVRPMPAEQLRYGRISEAAEYVYDRPFQWGSRRIGPDLHRVGKKYSHMWHYRHMMDPRDVTPGSIMPNYPWLYKNKVKFGKLTRKLSVLAALGAPYSEKELDQAPALAKAQADEIMKELVADGVNPKMANKEIIALIAYLQRLGVDMSGEKDEVASTK